MAGKLKTGYRRFATMLGLSTDHTRPPPGLRWRSNATFICTTVGVGMSVDVFMYGVIVPVLPFILEDRIGAPQSQLQSLTSLLLAVYAGASLIFSPIAGIMADRTVTRQAPFLLALTALLAATVLLFIGRSIAVLVLARMLQGISAAAVWTVGLALCMDTVGPANLGKVTGTIFSFVALAALLGPVAGGALYNALGYAGVFGVGAALLVLDFVMRLLVIEKRVAERYVDCGDGDDNDDGVSQNDGQGNEEGSTRERSLERREARAEEPGDAEAADEETPLLPGEKSRYTIKVGDETSVLLKKMPFLHCFRSSKLLTSILITFVQATLLGVFDSTVPIETKDLFGFDSLQAGLLFVPLGVADLIVGPPSGWAVDKYGTKPVAVLGFLWLCPAFISLRTVHAGGRDQIILFAALMALNGFGLSMCAAPSIVEAGAVVEKYHKANLGLFGDNGPYAQLYGFNSMLFSAGLTAGPILAGTLRETIGFGNMSLVVGIICGLTVIPCFLYLSGPVKKAPSQD